MTALILYFALATGHVPYKHAYYLYVERPVGCEACYIPLLICRNSLEEIAQGKQVQDCVVIDTYERDSIWAMKGAAPIAPSQIETPPRIIHLNERVYRYQKVSAEEVLKLLEHPLGTIPISRSYIPQKIEPGATLTELIADFRGVH